MIIKKIVKKYLTRRGNLVIRRVSIEKVNTLINKLKPVRIENDLIRLGPKGDGGYIVPNDLEGIEACFSPGVAKVSGFEEDCFKEGMDIYLADKSVEQPNISLNSNTYNFLKKHIGCSNSNDFITMDSWVDCSAISQESDLLLQMDIEGAEYYSFINMSDSLIKRFRIIVIEFHSLDKMWEPNFYNMLDVVFDKILKSHVCVHIHPNNCCGIHEQLGVEIPRVAEFTFFRSDRCDILEEDCEFPNELDFDNTSKESINLPKKWYQN